jgi:hypothetical protein
MEAPTTQDSPAQGLCNGLSQHFAVTYAYTSTPFFKGSKEPPTNGVSRTFHRLATIGSCFVVLYAWAFAIIGDSASPKLR